MIPFPRILLLTSLIAAVSVHAVGLPDTGQDTCYNTTYGQEGVAASSATSIASDAGSHPRQDCRYGRDPAALSGALTKTGLGAKGFDYTKVANNGALLSAAAALGTASNDWACTRDNITGLTWEVKTATNTQLRYFGHLYTWYSTNTTSNGGTAGSTGSNTCNATLAGGLCNTQAFVAAVNAAALCNATDWRMPTRRELLTLVNSDGSSASVAPTYFPYTPAQIFWTGSSYAPDPTSAWFVYFIEGSGASFVKSAAWTVRLVRGAQF